MPRPQPGRALSPLGCASRLPGWPISELLPQCLCSVHFSLGPKELYVTLTCTSIIQCTLDFPRVFSLEILVKRSILGSCDDDGWGLEGYFHGDETWTRGLVVSS